MKLILALLGLTLLVNLSYGSVKATTGALSTTTQGKIVKDSAPRSSSTSRHKVVAQKGATQKGLTKKGSGQKDLLKSGLTKKSKISEKGSSVTAKLEKNRKDQQSTNPSKNVQKSISFNDHIVRGKHQVPGEGLVAIENEKTVFNLLSIRSDFNDRREKERQRD